MEFLGYLYEEYQKGNDIYHYLKNLRFKEENLP